MIIPSEGQGTFILTNKHILLMDKLIRGLAGLFIINENDIAQNEG